MASSSRNTSPALKRRTKPQLFSFVLFMLCGIAPNAWSAYPQDSNRPAEPSSKTRIDGALVIGGGGGLPDSVFEEFIKLGGSADSHIVVIPTASTRADGVDSSGTIETWKKRGAATVTVLHTRDRDVAKKK